MIIARENEVIAVIIARENEVLDQSARAIFDNHQCNFTKVQYCHKFVARLNRNQNRDFGIKTEILDTAHLISF